jgi:hypothetical protein
MEQVATRWARGEPQYSVTKVGLDQLWELVSSDRLDTGERIALCLTLTELEGQRRRKRSDCAAAVR